MSKVYTLLCIFINVEHDALLICAMNCDLMAECRISEAVVAMQKKGKRVSAETDS
jgi:hypothetical protein